jgi:hypothetical protein
VFTGNFARVQSTEMERVGREVVLSQEIVRGVEVEQSCREQEGSEANGLATWSSSL